MYIHIYTNMKYIDRREYWFFPEVFRVSKENKDT